MDDEHEEGQSRAEAIGGRLGSGLRSLFAPAQPTVRPVTPLPFPSSAYVEDENGLDDLFEVPQEEDNDINCDDLLELDEEEGVEDLLTVSREDIVSGTRSKSKPKFTRTNRPYYPELTGMR